MSRAEVDERLRDIWLRILKKREQNVGTIDRETNFFDIGGTSLFIGIMTIMIQKEFGVKIGPEIFFANPTLGGIADEIITEGAQQNA